MPKITQNAQTIHRHSKFKSVLDSKLVRGSLVIIINRTSRNTGERLILQALRVRTPHDMEPSDHRNITELPY